MSQQIVSALVALWTLISAIVAMTPTHADDELVSAARRFLERLSFLQPSNSPGVLSMPGAPARDPVPKTDPPEPPSPWSGGGAHA